MFSAKESLLITGGTGSFGKQLALSLLESSPLRRIIIFSRDELKQFEMAQSPAFKPHAERLRFFIGDVRDRARLRQAFHDVDYIVHAAALKQVPACEYNPFEAVKTNVLGAENIIDAAIEANVKRVVALSTDKACNPVNLYGATKLCSDKLFVAGNAYRGDRNTRFGVVRYGNVLGSRGSVVPFFLEERKKGVLPITHPEMTRFWITLQQGVNFVLDSMQVMDGGEIFVPKIPSMHIGELAKAIAPDARHDVVGIRPGEKLHEMMISEDDARHTRELDNCFVIEPEFAWWQTQHRGAPVAENFSYVSNRNSKWLTADELRALILPIAHSLGETL